jgi:hypothetical protein
LATFAIEHLRLSPIPDEYRVDNKNVTLAQRIAAIAFDVYIKDVQDLIRKSLEKEVEKLLDDDGDDDCVARCKERRKCLKTWMKTEYPLDYKESNRLLTNVVVANHNAVGTGLPLASAGKISMVEFIAKVFELCQKTSRSPVVAPLIHGGHFRDVMGIAIDQMKTLAETDVSQDQNIFVKHYLQIVAVQKRIRYAPWNPDPSDGAGRPPQRAFWKVWMNLGRPNPGVAQLSIRIQDNLDFADSADAHTDPNVPWNLSGCLFQDLGPFLDRDVRPSDWVKPDPGADYVQRTFSFVYSIFDMKNPAHKMAVVAAAIFMRILPNIAFGSDRLKSNSIGASKRATSQFIQGSAWTYPGRRAGLTEKQPFVSLVITFVLGLLYEQSPLRRYMAEHNDALGKVWTKKFGESQAIQTTSYRILMKIPSHQDKRVSLDQT